MNGRHQKNPLVDGTSGFLDFSFDSCSGWLHQPQAPI